MHQQFALVYVLPTRMVKTIYSWLLRVMLVWIRGFSLWIGVCFLGILPSAALIANPLESASPSAAPIADPLMSSTLEPAPITWLWEKWNEVAVASWGLLYLLIFVFAYNRVFSEVCSVLNFFNTFSLDPKGKNWFPPLHFAGEKNSRWNSGA